MKTNLKYTLKPKTSSELRKKMSRLINGFFVFHSIQSDPKMYSEFHK